MGNVNSTDVRLGVDGVIMEGIKTGWKIRIEYDPEDTGGYYIFTSRNNENHDVWVATMEDLKEVFIETKWVISWSQ